MELIPFLFFAFVAFKIFGGFLKSSGSNAAKPQSKTTAKDLMQRLHEQVEQANTSSSNKARHRNSSPTQRGRESLARKNQSSPWDHEHDFDNNAGSPGGRVAANYLKTKATRTASHKSPIQHGRRGKNMDQNRHRTDEWGSRGDNSLLSGKFFLFLLIAGGGILFVLSRVPAG
ncbi:hypothetical protein N9M10_02965 [Hellea sp.]|nr:hypothetical protein [Hellea sp.]